MAERHSEFERDADDWYCEPTSGATVEWTL